MVRRWDGLTREVTGVENVGENCVNNVRFFKGTGESNGWVLPVQGKWITIRGLGLHGHP